MKLLLHACCAQCFTYPYKRLKEEGHEVTGYFYNPNIHPFLEYRNRLEALQKYIELLKAPMIYEDKYDLESFLRGALNFPDRCEFCYSLRLNSTARKAKERGFEAFSTTLLISPHQKHELIKKIGHKIGSEWNIPFYYEDFREGYKESIEIYKPLNLYRQKYCGCIFSEKERFAKKSV